MEKMKQQTTNITSDNISAILALFPDCLTEVKDENGKVKRAINFDTLRQHLQDDIVEGQEHYEFTWPGKRAAVLEAAQSIRSTLRPCPEESVNWDTTQNLYIEGDNLDVLKLLRNGYMGKVKMIYIDPPYNTGSDSFVYPDDFSQGREEYEQSAGYRDEEGNKVFATNSDSNGRFHSDWCSMMYSRLTLARTLLADDGVIFISIDDNEQANLKKICDEVFGSANMIVQIAWQNLDTIKNDAKYFSDNHEYILCYAKNKESVIIQGIKKGDKQRAYYKNYDNDPRGDYLLTPLHAKSGTESGIYSYTFKNGQVWTPPKGTFPRFSKETLKRLEDEGRIYLDPNGVNTPQKKTYLSEVGDRMPPVSFWDYKSFGSTRQSNKELSELIDKGMFQNPKPVKTLATIIDLIYQADDSIILDFFSGSATTAHAVMQLNAEDGGHRRFIMVQYPEECAETSEAYKAGYRNICEIGKERIRRAGKKIAEDAGLAADSSLDIGFRVLKVDSSNMKDVYYAAGEYSQGLLTDTESNIKEDRTDIDLLFGCLIDWGLPLSMPYTSEKIGDCTVHVYNDGDLIACFDDNIPDDVIKEIAKKQPMRAVFRDSSFRNSPSKINVGEIFKLIAPNTSVKVI